MNRELRYVDGASIQGKSCGVCQTPVAPDESVGVCALCEALHHVECWNENGGCSAYGCPAMPETVKAPQEEPPQTYWGQEEKECPSCHQSVKVAALRCRHCGQIFSTRVPEGNLATAQRVVPPARIGSWVLVLALFPGTSPLGLALGLIYWLTHRAEVRALPSTQRVQLTLGLVVSGVCSCMLVVAALVHSLAK